MSEHQQSGDQMEAAAPATTGGSDHNRNESQQVPLAALQAERAERQKLQDEFRMMREHMSLLQQAQSQHKEKDEVPEYDPNDVVTFGELQKFAAKIQNTNQASISELRMSQKHPDYTDVVTKYLPEVLRENPELSSSLHKTQDYDLAYYLAKNSAAYQKAHKTVKRSADAERILKNAEEAGSLSSVGQTSPINQAKRYRDMSDADFMKEAQKNAGYV